MPWIDQSAETLEKPHVLFDAIGTPYYRTATGENGKTYEILYAKWLAKQVPHMQQEADAAEAKAAAQPDNRLLADRAAKARARANLHEAELQRLNKLYPK